MTLGDRLRGCRIAIGWTLEEAARFSGLSLSYISDLEHGRTTNPTLDKLMRLCRAYRKSVVEVLLYVDGCMDTEPVQKEEK